MRKINDYYSKDHYRLTKEGFRKLAKEERFYIINLPQPLQAKQLIQLGKLLDFPYYVSYLKLIIFSDVDTLYLKLNGNNIASWLDSLEH